MRFERNRNEGLFQADSFLQVTYWIVNRQHWKREQGVSSNAMVLNMTKKAGDLTALSFSINQGFVFHLHTNKLPQFYGNDRNNTAQFTKNIIRPKSRISLEEREDDNTVAMSLFLISYGGDLTSICTLLTNQMFLFQAPVLFS